MKSLKVFDLDGATAELATRLPKVLRPDSARTVLRPFIIEDPSVSDAPRTRRVIDRILALDGVGLRDQLRIVADSLDDQLAGLPARHPSAADRPARLCRRRRGD